MPRILLFGTFDDLHPGHKFVLEEAKKRAGNDGEVHVIVARDASVERIKGRLPLQNEDERRQTIAAAFPSVRVHLGNNKGNFLEPVERVQPDLILLGYDQNLPPGITEDRLPCPVERLPSFHPDIHKSSLRRANMKN